MTWRIGSVRGGLALMMLAGVCSLSGCSLSNEQKLIGRWYNSDMTIRFRPDGGVVMNTSTGKAVGRYFYDGSSRNRGVDRANENLVLDVVRNNERIRLGFEVEVLSGQRIRLHDLTRRPRIDNKTGRIYSNVVLKRAEEGDTQLTM